MLWIGIGGLVLSGIVPYLIVRGRVRRPLAWAAGGLFVYFAAQLGMRMVMETASGREFYGTSALRQALDKGEIRESDFDRELKRTRKAFAASIAAALIAATGYGVAIRLSSKPKSA
jgi:hypothetical protein